MQPHSSKDMSKTSEIMQPPLLWNALPFDILYIVFDCVSESFPKYYPFKDYYKDFTSQDYTEDEVAIKQCFLAFSLVCRRWHVATQPYLLRVLSIRFEMSSTVDTVTRRRGLLDILQWLDSHPLLPGPVRHLRLIMDDMPVESPENSSDGSVWSSDESIESSDEPVWRGCDPNLVHTLLRFHDVRAVDLINLVFDSVQLTAHVSTITTAHADTAAPIDLDTLTIAYPTAQLPDVDVLQLSTAWFGSVSTLVMRARLPAGLVCYSMLENLPARLAARTIVIGTPIHPGVGKRLHCSPTFGNQGTLRALHVKFVSYWNIPWSLIRPASHLLEELHLDFTQCFEPQRATDIFPPELFIDLCALPRLRELTVQLLLTDLAWDILHRIILSLQQFDDDREHQLPPLRCVTLVPHGEMDNHIPWVGLRSTWVSAMLAGVPTLERCTLDLRAVRCAPDRFEQHKAWFREHMAKLHRKGLLHFVG
ncbi:hypothetical protein BDW22DRAFT_1356633 [Trametopsis cervina]|nr:hypothetical protein BDW22DRAFT_1356633 [Trametopsis cervina]